MPADLYVGETRSEWSDRDFALFLVAEHPVPWRWEMECLPEPCRDCGEPNCPYSSEPVILDADDRLVIDTRPMECGSAGRMAFAEHVVTTVNARVAAPLVKEETEGSE